MNSNTDRQHRLKTLPLTIISMLLGLILCCCNGVPSSVIQPEKMALLMADIHTGESVVDMNRANYNNDSLRLALKESIYRKHGVTSAEVDSSYMWYGRHMDRYMEVYDRTIEILEERLAEKGSLATAETAMSVSGDSVDVWEGARYLRYNKRMPTRHVTFSLKRDPNWETGDAYTWRAKMLRGGVGSTWSITADYADGTTETLHGTIGNEGWNELTFFSDTTRTLRRVYGAMTLRSGHKFSDETTTQNDEIWADSVSLVRNRLNRNFYQQRYRQRSYKY